MGLGGVLEASVCSPAVGGGAAFVQPATSNAAKRSWALTAMANMPRHPDRIDLDSIAPPKKNYNPDSAEFERKVYGPKIAEAGLRDRSFRERFRNGWFDANLLDPAAIHFGDGHAAAFEEDAFAGARNFAEAHEQEAG